MIETIYTRYGTIDFYYVSANIGSILAIFTVAVLLYRTYRKEAPWKHILLTILLCAGLVYIGGYTSTWIRQLSFGTYKDMRELFQNIANGYGNHFIGRVITIALLYLPCYRILYPFVFKEKKRWLSDGIESIEILSFFILIQHIFNRLGCLCRGCCFGVPYQGVFALQFKNIGIVEYPVFPTQLFEIFGMGVLLLFAAFLFHRGKSIFGITLCGFGVVIWLSEFFMDKRGTRLFLGFSVIQYAAFFVLLLGILYIFIQKKVWNSI